MSILPKPTPAPEAKSKESKQIALFYAGILVVLAVAQLFTFDSFLELFNSFNFPGGIGFAYFSGALLVASELFALPFLLRMPLSKAFRWVSMVAGWVAALIWIKTTIWVMVAAPTAVSIGFLGTALDILPGWWAVLISFVFGVCAFWASWGLWPGKRKK